MISVSLNISNYHKICHTISTLEEVCSFSTESTIDKVEASLSKLPIRVVVLVVFDGFGSIENSAQRAASYAYRKTHCASGGHSVPFELFFH